MKRFTIITLVTFFIAIVARAQQDPTQHIQEFNIHINNLGDADYEISTKLNQQQWMNFKQGQLANDPAIAKRDMQRAMSAYVIEDFKRDLDEMNRTVKMSFKVKAMAAYKGDGNWEMKLDSKDPQITKLSDNSFMSTSNAVFNGQLTQQIFKVFFPSSAGNIQQGTDSFNKAIFTYKNGGGLASALVWNNIVGVLLILGAGAVYYLTAKKENGQALSKVLVHAPNTIQTEQVNKNGI